MRTLSDATILALSKLEMCEGVGDGEGSACVMYQARIAAALEAGQLWPEPGDNEQSVSPVIRGLLIAVNDWPGWENAKERGETLRPLLPRVLGTWSTPELEVRRVWRALDWLVREELPALLPEEMGELRAIAPIVDEATAEAGVALALARARALALALDRALARDSRSRLLALVAELADMSAAAEPVSA